MVNTNTDLLLSLLRLVALVSPAMAILMQVLMQEERSDNPSFRFLEIGLLSIIVGGLIITGQLVTTIENSTTYSATLLIFLSLMFLALAIAWNAIPATRNVEIAINSPAELLDVAGKIISRIISFIIPISVAYFIYRYSADWLNKNLDIGIISQVDQLTPAIFFGILYSLMSIRVIFYLLNVGYLTQYSATDSLSESISATIIIYIIVPLFIAPVAIISYVLIIAIETTLSFSNPEYFFSLTYLWTVLVAFILFATELWAEEDDGERIVG